MTRINVCFILGTRPEVIKLSPVIRECKKRKVPFFIIHSNQHYSADMDSLFFDELMLPRPKYNLKIRESLHGRMVGKMMDKIEDILLKQKPSVVVVQGDTNTVLAGGLAASKLQIPVAHVEAGLRSYDRTMPEEINRVMVDHISTVLFPPTQKQKKILIGEGIAKSKVIVSGNTIVDAILENLKHALKDKRYKHYLSEKYILLTLHRPANVDDPAILKRVMSNINRLSLHLNIPVYFPAHPRTAHALSKLPKKVLGKQIKLMRPVQYLEMLMLERSAHLILTDSGGVQEEACVLGIPCITLRENTERPETVEVGANIVAGTTYEGMLKAAKKMMKSRRKWRNPFGDGHAGKRIVARLKQ